MTFCCYKSTIKNLLRSPTFWLCFCVLIVVSIESGLRASHGIYDQTIKEVIYDTDPRYILEYKPFIQWINNGVSRLISYMLPIFCVATTAIVLSRDYGDRFYEVEKAAGIKPFTYCIARIAALLTINAIVSILSSFLVIHLYVITRGGVFGMGLFDYVAESTLRILRTDIMRVLPCILFYICLTYLLGTLFKNNVVASTGGMAYAIFCYAHSYFNITKDGFFIDFIVPNPSKLQNYLHYYDTEWFDDVIVLLNTSSQEAFACIGILLSFSLLFFLISYLRIRKRTV